MTALTWNIPGCPGDIGSEIQTMRISTSCGRKRELAVRKMIRAINGFTRDLNRAHDVARGFAPYRAERASARNSRC